LFDPLQEEISNRGRTLLEEPVNPDQDFESYAKARTHYKACMNLQKLEEVGVKPLQVTLSKHGPNSIYFLRLSTNKKHPKA
jgi:hypothetical protein